MDTVDAGPLRVDLAGLAIRNDGVRRFLKTMSSKISSARQARMAGLREALGAPALVLGASYLGFGSLVRASDMSVDLALYSTATAWALPGQVAAVELTAAGASLLVVGVAVALTNARLLPLVLTLLPALGKRDIPKWRLYAVAHIIAVTSWVHALRRFPELNPEHRLSYLAAFGGTLWVVSIAMTAVGYGLAGAVPAEISLGLVFLNPVYFLLLLSGELRSRSYLLAMVLGAALAPVLHLVSADWGLLVTGIVAGTVAFWAGRLLSRRTGTKP